MSPLIYQADVPRYVFVAMTIDKHGVPLDTGYSDSRRLRKVLRYRVYALTAVLRFLCFFVNDTPYKALGIFVFRRVYVLNSKTKFYGLTS